MQQRAGPIETACAAVSHNLNIVGRRVASSECGEHAIYRASLPDAELVAETHLGKQAPAGPGQG